MRISSAFPSNYLKAADLQGRQVTVTIASVAMEDIGGDLKPILYFEGKEKGVVLNKTNSNTITTAYGDETDDWAGQQVVLFEAMVDFQGRTVPAIRVKVPPRGARRSPPPQAAQPPPADNGMGSTIDDEIPFSPEWRL